MKSIFDHQYAEFTANVGAPLLAIAAYSSHLGVPVGNGSTVLAAVLAGASIPVFSRFVLKPLFETLNLGSDRLLLMVGHVSANAALGLLYAVWLLPSVPL